MSTHPDYNAMSDAEFRKIFRDWVDVNCPQHLRFMRKQRPTFDEVADWYHALNDKGWLSPVWPVDYGGMGLDAAKHIVYVEEWARLGCPRIPDHGIGLTGPLLIEHGSDEQKAEFLPKILTGEHVWCQGYSEPGAGSDLASLKTRAVRDGDEWVINGQKTWTTLGQHADWIFCLCRTDADVKQQEGISFILIDMSTPGVEVRPIKLIEGGHEVNEVFFTDVRVPYGNLVGEENKGWTIAKYLLTHERTGIAGVGFSMLELEETRELAKKVMRNGKPLSEDPLFAARVAQAEIDLEAMKLTNLRMLFTAQKNGAPGPETSILKIKGTVINQEFKDLRRRALGPNAAPFPGSLDGSNLDVAPAGNANNAARYFNNRKTSIFGGSNEIQRNILTKTMLGL